MLEVTIGSRPGLSFRYKGPALVDVERLGRKTLRGRVHDFRGRAAVIFRGAEGYRMFVLEPSDIDNEFTFGPFGVRGQFNVSERINSQARVHEEWRAFEVGEAHDG